MCKTNLFSKLIRVFLLSFKKKDTLTLIKITIVLISRVNDMCIDILLVLKYELIISLYLKLNEMGVRKLS